MLRTDIPILSKPRYTSMSHPLKPNPLTDDPNWLTVTPGSNILHALNKKKKVLSFFNMDIEHSHGALISMW